MRIPRAPLTTFFSGVTVGALAVALMPAIASADPVPDPQVSLLSAGTVQPAASDWTLVRQEATLVPPASSVSAGRRIERALIDVSVGGQLQVAATVTLAGNATSTGDSEVRVIFGRVNAAGQCAWKAEAVKGVPTSASRRIHWLDGSTPSSWGPKPNPAWQCVIVATIDPAKPATSADFHHYVAGRLTDTYETRRLELGTVSVLGQKQKKLKVSKRGWTPVEVAVKNTGTVKIGKVTVRGKAKGLKVKAGSLTSISDGTTHKALIRVKKVGRKKPGKLTLTASASGVSAKRKIAVKQVGLPKKAAAGKYRGGKGRIRFTVKKNKITKFRIQTMQRCDRTGGSRRVTLAFPARKIPVNGIVHARAKGKGWSATLQLRISGKKATRATYRHYTGVCVAAEKFSAKRVGR